MSLVSKMMANKLEVHKYRTHGNDYLIIDNRTGMYDRVMEDEPLKAMLCNRVFGIGGIGICEIQFADNQEDAYFKMVYHLGTGEKGQACGTGTRCSIAYAIDAGIVPASESSFQFLGYEGKMTANVNGSLITQSMSDNCRLLTQYDDMNFFVDVNWCVHVRFVEDDIATHDIVAEGIAETDTEKYQHIPAPTFILAELASPGLVKMRCFDRTAKDYEEMYACGTGAVAMGISYLQKYNLYGKQEVTLVWHYGETILSITRVGNIYNNITLTGHARSVYYSVTDIENFKHSFTFFQKNARRVKTKWALATVKVQQGIGYTPKKVPQYAGSWTEVFGLLPK